MIIIMDVYFSITTPLGYNIRISLNYWKYLVEVKHPYMNDREKAVQQTLQDPDEVYASPIDKSVHLYYRQIERLYCVVARHLEGNQGFIITAYPVDKVKKGELVWTR